MKTRNTRTLVRKVDEKSFSEIWNFWRLHGQKKLMGAFFSLKIKQCNLFTRKCKSDQKIYELSLEMLSNFFFFEKTQLSRLDGLKKLLGPFISLKTKRFDFYAKLLIKTRNT